MKRVYIAAALLLIVAALCVYSSVRLRETLEPLLARCDEITAEEDSEKALLMLDGLARELESHETLFISFLRRDYYYELRRLITAVPTEDIRQGVATVREQIEVLLHCWFFAI